MDCVVVAVAVQLVGNIGPYDKERYTKGNMLCLRDWIIHMDSFTSRD